MKSLALESVFIFILGFLGFIVFVIFFSDVRNIIIRKFFEKTPEEEFEIEIINKTEFSEKFFLETLSFCIYKANISNLNLEIFPCYYLTSKNNFEKIDLKKIKDFYKNMNIRIITNSFNPSKNYAIVLFEKRTKSVHILN